MKAWTVLFVVCVSFAFQGGCGVGSSDATKSSKLNEEPQADPSKEAAAQMFARAVHLRYLAPDGGNAFYIELTPERSTLGTYFVAAGWSFGYFGIQEQRDGKKVAIFSVWDTHEQVQVLYVDPGAVAKRFGGEGTGAQCMYDFNWQVGGTYRFYVTATPAPDGRTAFSAFLYVGDRWVQLATFSTVTGGTALAGTYSFVEDFMRTNESAGIVRIAHFGNGWIRSGESDWTPLCSAMFTATDGPLDNINLSVNDRFALATGGDTNHGSILLNDVANLPACLSGQPPVDLPGGSGVEPPPVPVVPCQYNGQTYHVGDSFASADGCNGCSCLDGGQVVCSARACVEPPPVPVAAGYYAVGVDIYYSDGASYCLIPFVEYWNKIGNPPPTQVFAMPANMPSSGDCFYPAGYFSVGIAIYYSNGSAYCHMTSLPPEWTQFPRLPNNMPYDGDCQG